jgi:hypothetical protein
LLLLRKEGGREGGREGREGQLSRDGGDDAQIHADKFKKEGAKREGGRERKREEERTLVTPLRPLANCRPQMSLFTPSSYSSLVSPMQRMA